VPELLSPLRSRLGVPPKTRPCELVESLSYLTQALRSLHVTRKGYPA